MSGPADDGRGTPTAHQLVAGLIERRLIRSEAVEAAFRTVDRRVFLPDLPEEEVYRDDAIVTRRSDQGEPTSSSSQPAIMAIMLEQLAVRPGQRVLEIGAGTGYNAGLLARLTGAPDRVTTVEIDPGVAADARRGLAAAGLDAVAVHTGDGWLGLQARAPFDRIEVTVGVDDLSPHWADQLTDGGMLVAPLWLAPGVEVSVAFVKHGAVLHSRGVQPCGFVRLRGLGAGRGRRLLRGGWLLDAETCGPEADETLLDLLQSAARVEPAPSLPRGWPARLSLDSADVVRLSRPDGTRALVGVFDPAARSLAAIETVDRCDTETSVAMHEYGVPGALPRLRELLAGGSALDVRRLRVTAVPRGRAVDGPARWRRERTAFSYLIEEVDAAGTSG